MANNDGVITPRSTPAVSYTAPAVEMLRKLRDVLLQMQYDPTPSQVEQLGSKYRDGWNDAVRAAVRELEARIGAELMCLRCDWHVRSRSSQLAQLAAKYVACPRCRRGDMLTVREVSIGLGGEGGE